MPENTAGYHSLKSVQKASVHLIAFAVLLMCACEPGQTPAVSEGPEVKESSVKETANDDVRLDSLWHERVVRLEDSLKYGVYSTEWENSPNVHLNEDGTVKVIYESRFAQEKEDGAVAARAVWTSEWTSENEVFLVSREPESFKLTGQPPLVEEDDEGMIPLDSDEIPYEDMFLWETADMLRKVVEKIDTCYVMLRYKDIDPSEQMVFLLSSGHVPPIKRGRDHYDYNSDILRDSFHKPYPFSIDDQTEKTTRRSETP